MARQIISDTNDATQTVVYLPRISANTQASVASAEICRWNFVPTKTGQWSAAITGQGSTNVAGMHYMELRINEAVCGYMEHGFTSADLSQYRTITAGYGTSATSLTQGVTYVVRMVNYSVAGNAFFSDGNNTYSGLMFYTKGV